MVTDCRRRRLLSLLPLLLTNGGHIIINDITYDMNKLWYTWYDMRDSDLWLMKIGERSLAENKSIPISIVTKLSTSDIDKFTHKFGMSIKWMVINGFHWLETLFMNSVNTLPSSNMHLHTHCTHVNYNFLSLPFMSAGVLGKVEIPISFFILYYNTINCWRPFRFHPILNFPLRLQMRIQ